MFLTTALKFVDTFLCDYFGLREEVCNPMSVKNINGKLIISYTEVFKRYCNKTTWENFEALEFDKLSEEKKARLGVAIGKSLAKKLLVSFANELQ